jgi:hypothetical protein
MTFRYRALRMLRLLPMSDRANDVEILALDIAGCRWFTGRGAGSGLRLAGSTATGTSTSWT